LNESLLGVPVNRPSDQHTTAEPEAAQKLYITLYIKS